MTPWTLAHQAPLSMKFSRQEYSNGVPFPTPGALPDPGIVPESLASPALAGRFFTISATWEAPRYKYGHIYVYIHPYTNGLPWWLRLKNAPVTILSTEAVITWFWINPIHFDFCFLNFEYYSQLKSYLNLRALLSSKFFIG